MSGAGWRPPPNESDVAVSVQNEVLGDSACAVSPVHVHPGNSRIIDVGAPRASEQGEGLIVLP